MAYNSAYCCGVLGVPEFLWKEEAMKVHSARRYPFWFGKLAASQRKEHFLWAQLLLFLHCWPVPETGMVASHLHISPRLISISPRIAGAG